MLCDNTWQNTNDYLSTYYNIIYNYYITLTVKYHVSVWKAPGLNLADALTCLDPIIIQQNKQQTNET